MAIRSAGIIAYRVRNGGIEVLLVHPGGPLWKNKDAGAWSIPKGEYGSHDEPERAARREFAEELGTDITVPVHPLGEIKQRGGKIVVAFAADFDFDTQSVRSNSFELEWPPRSGNRLSFPEVDRAEWFTLIQAREKINEGQTLLLDRVGVHVTGLGLAR